MGPKASLALSLGLLGLSITFYALDRTTLDVVGIGLWSFFTGYDVTRLAYGRER